MFIAFVMFGWAKKSLRKIHVTAILLTLTAWLLLGMYVGTLGYCPLTDWHWDIKRALGETTMPSSFVDYIILQFLGIKLEKSLVDMLTASGLAFGVTMAIFCHFKNRLSHKVR